MKYRTQIGLAALAASLASGGCVERVMKISTTPTGARVFINDEEVGLSPVKVSFVWYGDYDIVIRKQGYETLKTHSRLEAPWYQYPVVDLVAETMIPTMIRDEHVLPDFVLTPAEIPPSAELVGRATEMRDRTTFGGGE
ncbi:MAG: hypothetical protein AMXMBFR47_43970 [Planctomycetota bacterium]